MCLTRFWPLWCYSATKFLMLFYSRMEIYQQVTMVLDQLYQQSMSGPAIPSTSFALTPAAATTLSPADAEAQVSRTNLTGYFYTPFIRAINSELLEA